MMPGWMMSGWGLGYGLFGWLMMLLFWILIIVGVVLVVRWFMNQEKPKWLRTEETALDIRHLEKTVRHGRDRQRAVCDHEA